MVAARARGCSLSGMAMALLTALGAAEAVPAHPRRHSARRVARRQAVDPHSDCLVDGARVSRKSRPSAHDCVREQHAANGAAARAERACAERACAERACAERACAERACAGGRLRPSRAAGRCCWHVAAGMHATRPLLCVPPLFRPPRCTTSSSNRPRSRCSHPGSEK